MTKSSTAAVAGWRSLLKPGSKLAPALSGFAWHLAWRHFRQ